MKKVSLINEDDFKDGENMKNEDDQKMKETSEMKTI